MSFAEPREVHWCILAPATYIYSLYLLDPFVLLHNVPNLLIKCYLAGSIGFDDFFITAPRMTGNEPDDVEPYNGQESTDKRNINNQQKLITFHFCKL